MNDSFKIVPRTFWEVLPPVGPDTPDTEESENPMPPGRIVIEASGKSAYLEPQNFPGMPYHFYILGDGTVAEGKPLRGDIHVGLAGCFNPTCDKEDLISSTQRAALDSLVATIANIYPELKPDENIFLDESAQDLGPEVAAFQYRRALVAQLSSNNYFYHYDADVYLPAAEALLKMGCEVEKAVDALIFNHLDWTHQSAMRIKQILQKHADIVLPILAKRVETGSQVEDYNSYSLAFALDCLGEKGAPFLEKMIESPFDSTYENGLYFLANGYREKSMEPTYSMIKKLIDLMGDGRIRRINRGVDQALEACWDYSFPFLVSMLDDSNYTDVRSRILNVFVSRDPEELLPAIFVLEKVAAGDPDWDNKRRAQKILDRMKEASR